MLENSEFSAWQEKLDKLFSEGALFNGELLVGGVLAVVLSGENYLSLWDSVSGRDQLVPVYSMEERSGVLHIDTGDTTYELSNRLSEKHRALLAHAKEAW